MNIVTFEDGTRLDYELGKFNEYCLHYTKYVSGAIVNEWINSKTYLLRIKNFAKLNDKKILDIAIDKIYKIRSPWDNDLNCVIETYKDSFKPNKLFWVKVAYLICSMYYADDNWPNTKLGRNIANARTKRVAILDQDIDYVCNIFDERNLGILMDLIDETNTMVNTLFKRQKSLFDF